MYGVPVKQQGLDKARTQLASVSALRDLWWQEVWPDVQQQVALIPLGTSWGEEWLLPLLYWQEQRSPTRWPRRTAKMLPTLAVVQPGCETHPSTQPLAPEVVADGPAWATEHAQAVQRASSAVEGRNGSLAQMHHNHRGLPQRRYQVWTVLHYFDCRASDRTTPASRFFRREVPGLFETVRPKIDELPRPRRRNPAMALSD
jgi:hypothetical protein